MNNFNLNLLKYFYYVAVHKGFTNASKILNVAQPALSYNVKKLEEEMNLSLINRGSNHFELTEDGKRIFEILKTSFGMLENNLECFASDSDSYNEINIGVRQSISDYLFMDMLGSFFKDSSNIKLNINFFSETDVTKKLLQKEYDVIFDYDYNIASSDEIVSQTLFICNNYFVCGNNYILKNTEKEYSIKRLNGEFLISPRPSRKKGMLQKLCHENNIAFIDVISIDNSKLYNEFVVNNYGIGIVNELELKSRILRDKVRVLKISEELFPDVIKFSYMDNSNNRALKKLILFLTEFKVKGDE